MMAERARGSLLLAGKQVREGFGLRAAVVQTESLPDGERRVTVRATRHS